MDSYNLVEHMTPVAKASELQDWEERKAGPRGRGGDGFTDDRIIPLCDRINKLSGVCTQQSCAGHPPIAGSGIYPGNLWLWFDESTFNAFLRHAPALAEDPSMESIDLLYGRYRPHDRRVVASLSFAGDERGPDALEHSGDIIYRFLLRLSVDQGLNG